jgi:shikimate dehydrogenase
MNVDARVTGKTRLYAIIGDPIAQVRSPETFNARFASAGIDAFLFPAHVTEERFDSAVRGLLSLANLDGIVITVPHKARTMALATRLQEGANVVGAINVLRRESDGSWTGAMFDGAGMVHAFRRKGARLEGRVVLLYGAGGAGSAIACSLAEAGVKSMDFIDPMKDRVDALIARLKAAFPNCRFGSADAWHPRVDMIVNASPVGMYGKDAMPGEIGSLDADTIVGDVVLSERSTSLIQHASDHGCLSVTGREMHAGQIDAILQFFGFDT